MKLVERPIAHVLVEQFHLPEPEQERLWIRGWSDSPVRIRGAEHLTVLLTTLNRANDHAGVTDEATGAWAQVKRLGERWWVEGRGPSDEWPRVFVPEAWLEEPGHRPVNDHACWGHATAAELIWAFLDRRTIDGAIQLPAPGGDDV